MRFLRSLPLCVLATALLCSAAAMAQQFAPTVRIVNPIDESQLITLQGTVHPLANAANDRGAAPESMQLERMHLVLKRSSSQELALRQFIGNLHTPGSASYHKWLTPDEFGKQFGPSDQDIATVETWLAGHGFNVTQVNPGKQTIEFSGNVTQFRDAFHAQIHKYQVNGETHYANADDPKIPAAIAPVVGGFVSLNNFRLKNNVKVLGKALYDPKTDKATPEWTFGNSSGVSFVLAPSDYAVQYDLGPLYASGINGSGQSIAILDFSNINVDLVNQFRSLFGLPYNPPQVIIDGNDPGVGGINNPDGSSPDIASEAYLDVEWAGAVAPNATIDLVVAANTALENGGMLAAEHAVYSNIAPIISSSIATSGCEQQAGGTNAFIANLWEQAAAQGITVLVSAGDNGSAGCDSDAQYYGVGGLGISSWASTPYNIAVGGTDFYYSSYNQGDTALDNQLVMYWNASPTQLPAVSLKSVIPEQPWNDSQYGLNVLNLLTLSGDTVSTIKAGSGGASVIYTTKPSWQTGFGDGVRDIPDLSLFAADGPNYSYYPICAEDGDCQSPSGSNLVQITGAGGTSASSPSFAGIMALVNQKYGRQGQADFVLYPMKAQYPAAFHDVLQGTNSVPCSYSPSSPDCIAVLNPVEIDDPTYGYAEEGQIGNTTTETAECNAAAGYNLATGLGTVDANQLVTNWGNIKFASTATTLIPSSTSFTHGTAIGVSGSVTTAGGTPTGDVALMTSSTEPSNQGETFFTLSGGSFNANGINYLPGGTYNIWGQYGGDRTNGPSTSTPVQITVSPETSAIVFNIFSPLGTYTASSPPGSSVDYGTQLLLSARPTPTSGVSTYTVPTGTVTFSDGAQVLNTAVINAEGDAEYNAPFSVGAHSVTANYGGDQSYNQSTASAIAFAVVKDTPKVLINAPIATKSGQLINGPGQPTVVSVQIENNAQSSVASSRGIYPVPVAPPTGTLTYSSSPSGISGTVTLSPAVDPNYGAVEGVANITAPAGTPAGTYNVTVTYSGDANYNGGSATLTGLPIVNVTGLPSTINATMTGSISPTTSVTIAGTVVGVSGYPAPTSSAALGTGIEIYASGDSANYNSLGMIFFSSSSGDFSNFSYSLNSQTLPPGANLITLQYTGDANYAPSAITLNSGNPISNPLSDFTLVPQTTILPVAAGSSGTTTINLASVNGFSGAVSLTCTAASGVTCSIPGSASLASGGSASATLTVNTVSSTANGPYNVLVVGKDSTGKYVHTLGLEAFVSSSPTGAASFALSNSGNISVSPGATTGNTSTVSVTPSNEFTGTVDLSCAVTNSPAGATSPATCSVPSTVSITGTAAATATLSVATTSTTTAGAYVVTVTGTSASIMRTTTVNVTVTGVASPTFALSNSGNISVSPGATTGNTSTITIMPSGGFTGLVSLSCVITPTAASDPATCSVPASVSITSSSAQTATLTVNTTAATSSLNQNKKPFWPSAGGTALALVLFFGIPRRRRSWLAVLGLLVLFVSIAGIGCGGGGGGGGSPSPSPSPSNPGTSAGTYVATVTGTSGTGTSAITQTTAVTVTVN
jgi:subtilase family serine protease